MSIIEASRAEHVTYDVVALGTGDRLPKGFVRMGGLLSEPDANAAAQRLADSGEPCEVIRQTVVSTLQREVLGAFFPRVVPSAAGVQLGDTAP